MEQGMASCSAMVSYHSGAATVRHISALEQGPIIPQSNLASQRTADVLVPEGEMYTRTPSKHFGVEQGTSTDAVEIVVVPERGIPVATAEGRWIVAVGILAEVEDKRTAGADIPKGLTAAGGNLNGDVVAILMGSLVHQGRSQSAGKTTEVDCNQARSRTGSRIPCRVARDRPQCGVMEKSQILGYSAAQGRRRKDYTRAWTALVANAKAWEESGRHVQGSMVGYIHYPKTQENVAPES